MKPVNYRQMICTETHEALIDWAMIVRDRAPQGHCQSIEHRYRPEALRGDEEEDRRAPDLLIDTQLVLTIEKVITSVIFPNSARQFLKAHYVYRAQPQVVCRYVGLPYRDFDLQWYRSVLIVKNRMKLVRKIDLANCY